MNQLDKDILDLKEKKRTLQSLERLLVNSDFKRVIQDEFLTKHPLNLVLSKGMLGIQPQTVQDIERQLDCVALFNLWLDKQVSQIADIDRLIDEAETLRDKETQGYNQ